MDLTDIPLRLPAIWANGAGGGYITYPVPTPSQVGITNGAASFFDGFPPNNFISYATGGAGPLGKDYNGILKQVTAGVQWLQAGGPVVYDSTFSTAIGGYPEGAILSSDLGAGGSLAKFWISLVDDNASDPDTGGAGWLALGMRTKLFAATTYYVDCTVGNNANPGTAALPWARLQHAWDTLYATVDGGGQNVTISQTLSGGADPNGLVCAGQVPGVVTVLFDLDGGISTAAAAAISASDAARISVTGAGTLVGATWDLVTQTGGFIGFQEVTLGACARAKVSVGQQGQIRVDGSYTDDAGGSLSHFEQLGGDLVVFPSATITQTGAVYTQFALSAAPGLIKCDTLTFAGTPSTGNQFSAIQGGGIYRNDATWAGTYAANGGNTGNFTCGAVTVSDGVPGTYRIEFLAATIFNVYYPSGGFIGSGATGSAFTGGGISFTITVGGTPAVLGDGATIAMASTSLPGTGYTIDYTTGGWFE